MPIFSSSALRLALAGALILGEAGTALLALFPRVDTAYRDFFIHRTATCWLPPPLRRPWDAADLGADAVPALLDMPTLCRLLPSGWYGMPGTWFVFDQFDHGMALRGAVSRMDLPCEGGGHSVAVLLGNRDPAPLNGVTVSVGDGPPVHVALPSGAQEWAKIDLGDACRVDGAIASLTLQPDHPAPTAMAAGARPFGLALLRVRRE